MRLVQSLVYTSLKYVAAKKYTTSQTICLVQRTILKYGAAKLTLGATEQNHPHSSKHHHHRIICGQLYHPHCRQHYHHHNFHHHCHPSPHNIIIIIIIIIIIFSECCAANLTLAAINKVSGRNQAGTSFCGHLAEKIVF